MAVTAHKDVRAAGERRVNPVRGRRRPRRRRRKALQDPAKLQVEIVCCAWPRINEGGREGERAPKNHLSGGYASALRRRRTEAQEDQRQLRWPILGGRARAQRILHAPVETLDHSVALRVIRRGAEVLDPQSRAGLSPGGADELRALVSGEHGRHTEPRDPTVEECAHAPSSRDVLEGNRLGPARRPVHDGEDVAEPVHGLQGPDKVHVHVGESPLRNRNVLHFRALMTVHLGGLAAQTVPDPARHVSLHARPQKPPCEETTGSTRTRMRDVVDLIESSTAQVHRDE